MGSNTKIKMIINRILFGKHLEEKEEILYAVHKHWVELAKPALEVGFFGFVIPWGLYALGFNTPLFFWAAVVLFFFFFLMIRRPPRSTQSRSSAASDVYKRQMFNNLSSRVGFEDIEGATYEIAGLWATVFRYGKMTLRVMSGSHFEMKHVANPKKAELAIVHFREQFVTERNIKDTDSLKVLLAGMVARQARSEK